MTLPIAMIAEYIVLSFGPEVAPPARRKHSPAELIRMNQLALQLGMTLPDAVWGAITDGLKSGNWAGAWAAVDAVRSREGLDPRDPEHAVIHRPGVGKP